MKIRNVTLSLMWCAVLAMWLWELSALAADGNGSNGGKDIGLDITNAVQHIGSVKIISVEGGEGILTSAGNSLVWITAKNFIISQTGANINTIDNGGDASNILWGASNTIGAKTASTILWWQENMNYGNYSTILWWKSNRIIGWDYSTVVGWTNNVLQWDASVILWGSDNNLEGNYSAVLWSNAEVKWNYSVALWNNSKVEANNSFLWTDGNKPTLTTSNVFAINSEHWMVVNTGAAHSFAKLTIGWPLVINAWGSVACDADHKWVLKVVNWASDNSGYKCFCSCDGTKVDNKYYWHSLYGQWKCEWICNRNVAEENPTCGTTASINHSTHEITVTCGNKYSKPVVGDGAYFVDKDGYIYWSCQTDAGKTIQCDNNPNN